MCPVFNTNSIESGKRKGRFLTCLSFQKPLISHSGLPERFLSVRRLLEQQSGQFRKLAGAFRETLAGAFRETQSVDVFLKLFCLNCGA